MSESRLSLKKPSVDENAKLKQESLDHEQHYDIDGVTEKNGVVVIPSNFKIQTNFSKRPDEYRKSIESTNREKSVIE